MLFTFGLNDNMLSTYFVPLLIFNSTFKSYGLNDIIDSSFPAKPSSNLIPLNPISLNTDKSVIDAPKFLNTVGSKSAITSIPCLFATSNILLNSATTSSVVFPSTESRQVKILLKPYFAANSTYSIISSIEL